MIYRYVRSPRRLIVIAAFAILSASAFGFAAANTVPDSIAGDGEGGVTGVVVSQIHYNLDANDPTLVTSVALTVDALPTSASATGRVQLVDTTGTWFSCNVTANPVVCATPGQSVLAIDQVQFVIAD